MEFDAGHRTLADLDVLAIGATEHAFVIVGLGGIEFERD